MNRRWRGITLGWGERFRSFVGFLPLIGASVLIALIATTAGPASTYCLFQSPIGPPSPLPTESPLASPAAPLPAESPGVGATSTPSVLRAVPTPPNFVPWIIGLLVVVIVVGAIVYWRSRRKGEEGA